MNGRRCCRWARWGWGAAMLMLVSGCIRESNVNGDRVFEYSIWPTLLAVLAGGVFIAVGILTRQWSRRGSWLFYLAGAFCLVIIAPGYGMYRVVIGKDHIAMQCGFLEFLHGGKIDFSQAQAMTTSIHTRLTRTGYRTCYFASYQHKSGKSGVLEFFDTEPKEVLDAILEAFREHGHHFGKPPGVN